MQKMLNEGEEKIEWQRGRGKGSEQKRGRGELIWCHEAEGRWERVFMTIPPPPLPVLLSLLSVFFPPGPLPLRLVFYEAAQREC